jgi:hypothetical protein
MKVWIILSIALLPAMAYGQCALREIPLGERVLKSTLVAEGQVISQQCYKDGVRGHIYTSSSILVHKVFKGFLHKDTIELETPGGISGNEMETTSSLLSLTAGEYGILVCTYSPSSGQYIPYGSSQGFIRFAADGTVASDPFREYAIKSVLYPEIIRHTGQEARIIRETPLKEDDQKRKAAAPVVTSLSPSSVPAGTGSVLTIQGVGFGLVRGSSQVSFKAADDGGRSLVNPLPSQYVSWSDSQIRVRVPFRAGTGTVQVNVSGLSANSPGQLTIPYSRLNQVNSLGIPVMPDFINQSGNGGYVWRMSQEFFGNAAANASFMRAFNNWKCTSFVNWGIGPVTPVNATRKDNENIIRFDEGNELPEGVLGVCYNYYIGCTNDVWYVSELDIIFDDGLLPGQGSVSTWQFGPSIPLPNQIDFESVALHELGHGQQLAHVINEDDLMHYALEFGRSKRSISPDNNTGAQVVMEDSREASLCGPDPMIPLTAANCLDSAVNYIDEIRVVTLNNQPFSDRITIKYSLVEDAPVFIALYSLSGLRIATLVSDNQTGGSYTAEIVTNELPGGIYLMRILINEKPYNIKLVRI